MNFRAGLLLVPMGIINEYHEPTTFNGVERPIIDNRISLSTWREVGFGFSGNIMPLTMKYQLYVVGGLNGYDTKGIFTGSSGLREGRQKGSKAYASSPALTGKVEYYGIKNLNIGLSGYFGKSQSKLYSKLPKDNTALLAGADSENRNKDRCAVHEGSSGERSQINGKFFDITGTEVKGITVYIGRVNSCRAGGCTNPSLTGMDAESEYFDYFILFDSEKRVKLVRVFNYAATHGQEVAVKRWLDQFAGHNGAKPLRAGKEIDGISGATISVNAIVADVNEKIMLLNQ